MKNLYSKSLKLVNEIKNTAPVSSIFEKEETSFTLKETKSGFGIPILFIDGFLTKEKGCTSDWEEQLQQLYPNNPWHHLSWDSENLQAIGQLLSTYVGSRIILGNVLANATPLGIPLAAYTLMKNPWSNAYANAKKVGKLLGEEIEHIDTPFILCGHSLGARVIYFALKHLALNNKTIIQDVHLLGGAVSSSPEHWDKVQHSVQGNINNYLSKNDKVLSMMYKVGTGFTNTPIGVKSIDVERVNNVDVSYLVSGHTEYKENFSKFIVLS